MNSLERSKAFIHWLERILPVSSDEREALLSEAEAAVPGLRRELEDNLKHEARLDSTPGLLFPVDQQKEGERLLEELRESDPLATKHYSRSDRSHDAGEPERGPDAVPLLPSTIGPFRVLKKLGEGGMSTVYLGEHTEKGEWYGQVAIKVMTQTSPELAERLRQERSVIGQLKHPGIAHIRDGGETTTGQPYLVIEYVDGEDIDFWCYHHRLSIGHRIGIFLEVCSAVEAAHQSLVIHRDIKPSNVLVGADREVKLLDFGIATSLDPERSSSVDEISKGSAQYSSPEQIEGKGVDTRSDVYSLGVLLYRLLTNAYPYPSDFNEWLRAVDQGKAKSLRAGFEEFTERTGVEQVAELFGDTPLKTLQGEIDELEWVVRKALAKDKDDRYASVRELAAELERYLRKEALEAHPVSRRYQFNKLWKRKTGVVAAGFGLMALALLVLVLALGWAITSRKQAAEVARERDTAERTLRMFEDLFSIADPEHASFGGISVDQIIAQGERTALGNLARDTKVAARLAGALGVVQRSLGKYDRGEVLLRRAIASEARDDEHSRYTLELSDLLLRAGDSAEAKKELEELRGRLNKKGLANTEDYGRVLRLLGAAARASGDGIEAERLLREGVAVCREAGCQEELASQLAELGMVLTELAQGDDAGPDKVKEAEQAFAESLRIREETLPEWHPLRVESVNNLAVCFGMQGRIADAEELLREALALRREQLGETHPAVAEALGNLAQALFEQEQFLAATELLQESERIALATLGEAHPRTYAIRHNLAQALVETGQAAEGVGLLEKVYDGRLQDLGVDDWRTGNSLRALGSARLELGDTEVGLDNLRRAVALLTATAGAKHWRTANAEAELGLELVRLGRPDGREVLVRSWHTLNEVHHPKATKVAQLAQELGVLVDD